MREERRQVDVVAGSRDEAERVAELRRGRSAGHVERNAQVWLAAQDVIAERRQVSSRANLHEGAETILVHRQDRLLKCHRCHPLIDGEAPDGVHVGGKHGFRGTTVRRRMRRTGDPPIREVGDRRNEATKRRRMIRAIELQAFAENPLPLERRHRRIDRIPVTGNDGLQRTVLHRDVQLAANLLQHRRDGPGVGANGRQQRRRVGFLNGHGLMRADQLRREPVGRRLIMQVDHAAGRQGSQLARAMSEEGVGTQSGAPDQLEQR